MAPEQAGTGTRAGASADVYSLGVILHYLLTNRYPIEFESLTEEERYWALQHKPPTPPGAWNPHVPSELDKLVLRCLDKEPAQRPADATALRNHFEQVLKTANAIGATWTETKVAGNGPRRNVPAIDEHSHSLLESVGGAVPINSPFYVERPADRQFLEAATRSESVILLHGPRQIGKTSLLARGLKSLRQTGRKVVLIDFQAVNSEILQSLKSLYIHLASEIADQLALPDSLQNNWDDRRPANTNFERFLTRTVLSQLQSPLILAMDEVDRLFSHPYSSELFGMIRSWHNARALNSDGPWSRLTMALVYATEVRLFIVDLNQSPFNIGARVDIEDLQLTDISDLNRRFQRPLKSPDEEKLLFDLVGGHPFLVRLSFNHLIREKLSIADLEARAIEDSGPYSSHLRHAAGVICSDSSLMNAVQSLVKGTGCPTVESFFQLRSAGLAIGESARKARFRCKLYARYFGEMLDLTVQA
jgi:hypothetical protein